MKTSSIVDQFREEGYAIVRQLFDGEDVLRLQRETADFYQAGIQHPVTFKHGNLAYEILPKIMKTSARIHHRHYDWLSGFHGAGS